MAWRCSPSHWRRRGDQLGVLLAPPGVQPLLELVEHEQHLLAGAAAPCPRRSAASVSTRPSAGGQVGADLAQASEQPSLGLVGGRLDVDRQTTSLRQPGQQPRLDQRRLAAARGTVDQADVEGRCRGRSSRSASSRSGCSRAGRRGRAGRGAARGRSRRRARRTTAAPSGTILIGCRLSESSRPGGGVGDASAASSSGRGPTRRGSGRRAADRGVGLEEDAQVVGHVAGRAYSARRRRLASVFRQIRSSSLGIVSSICRGGRGSAAAIWSMTSGGGSPRNGRRPVSSS